MRGSPSFFSLSSGLSQLSGPGQVSNLSELQCPYLQVICLNLNSSESRGCLKNLGTDCIWDEGVGMGRDEGRGEGSKPYAAELPAAVVSGVPSCGGPCKLACRMPSELSLQRRQVEALIHGLLYPFGWGLSPGDPTSGRLAP